LVKKISRQVTLKEDSEILGRQHLLRHLIDGIENCGPAWEYHLPLFMTRQALSRQIYFDSLYRQLLDVPGVICEFGVQWGSTLATLTNLRGIYEPYNYSRHIYGFDTFSGFASVDVKDGPDCEVGDYTVIPGYEKDLEKILALHEANSPLTHIKKTHLVKGDVTDTLPIWLDANPHAVISMAIFDMDVYSPTKLALEAILPRLTKGSILVFDELNCPQFPGETQALAEVIGLAKLRLRRSPHQPYCAWAVWGE
jgi:hypothetical protein